MKKLAIRMTLPLLTFLGACEHKDLCFDHYHVGELNVVFDWRNAPDANPASMITIFYGNEQPGLLRYLFEGKDGGKISLPVDTYAALALNADDNEWVKLRNIETIDNYETYTVDAENTQAYGLLTRALPRAAGTEQERMAQTPGMLWTNRLDNIVHTGEGVETITFYPEEAVCHYTVDIYDITNLEHVDRAELDGTISGMAEGFNHGAKCPTDNHVTMPFTLTADIKAQTMHAEFLTFGECPHSPAQHILTLYMYLSDGSKWYYNFDVTDQVHNAPDPRHVHITLRGLSLPHPITAEGGFKPNVNDWQTEDIDLQM